MEKNIISINKKISEKSKIVEIKEDIIVPDSKPDVVSVIATNSNSYISKEEINNKKYRFDGVANTNIIYLSDNAETQCIKSNLSFMEFIEDDNFSENMYANYIINILNIESKVLNERKISVTLKIRIDFKFFEKNDIEYLDKIDTIENVEKLQEKIDISALVGINKISTNLTEEFELGELVEATDIIKNDIFISNIENKISYNKVLSKADVSIKLLYLDQNIKTESFETTIPITNFIDMEKITDENICKIDYKIRNLEFKINEKEKNKVSIIADFEVSCESYIKQEINIIQDMYGLTKTITFSQKSIELQTFSEATIERISINENILVEDIRKVYDVDCKFNITNKKNAGSFTDYEGEVGVEIYFDNGNALNTKSVKVPFEAKMKCISENVEINILKKHYKLNNEEVWLDLEAELRSDSSSYKKINLIDEIEEQDAEPTDNYSMVIYFIKKGDTIWKIAKMFKVSMESIIKNNNLEDPNKIYPGEKLYIVT